MARLQLCPQEFPLAYARPSVGGWLVSPRGAMNCWVSRLYLVVNLRRVKLPPP